VADIINSESNQRKYTLCFKGFRSSGGTRYILFLSRGTPTSREERDDQDAVLLQLGHGRVIEGALQGLGRDVGDGHHIRRDGLGQAGGGVDAEDFLLTNMT
jgi:hypothetical protein